MDKVLTALTLSTHSSSTSIALLLQLSVHNIMLTPCFLSTVQIGLEAKASIALMLSSCSSSSNTQRERCGTSDNKGW